MKKKRIETFLSLLINIISAVKCHRKLDKVGKHGLFTEKKDRFFSIGYILFVTQTMQYTRTKHKIDKRPTLSWGIKNGRINGNVIKFSKKVIECGQLICWTPKMMEYNRM